MKPTKTTPADALMAMGIRRLLDNHPLLGGLLAQWRVFEGRVGTMAVGWDGSRISLIYEPDFVSSLTMVQLENVLMHEVRHVIYGHCFMDPADWPDRQALVIAQEVTVNEGLDDLPGDPIVLEDYACLKPNTDTHERYAVLAVDIDDGPNGPKGDDGPGQAPKDSAAHEDGQDPVPGQSEPGEEGEPGDPSDTDAGQRGPGDSGQSGDEDKPESQGDQGDKGEAEGLDGQDGQGDRGDGQDGQGTTDGDGMSRQRGDSGSAKRDAKSAKGDQGDTSSADNQDGADPSDQRGEPSRSPGNAEAQVGQADTSAESNTIAPSNPSQASVTENSAGVPGSDRASKKAGEVSPLDDHASWGDLLENRSQIAADLRGAISQILAKTQDLKDDVQDAEQATSTLKICGTQAGSSTTVLGAKRRQISTQQLHQMLAQMGGSSRDRGAQFDRPPRRAPELLGIVPAHALMRNRVNALAVIDTSGSIDDATLASVAAVLRRIEDVAELTVVECDAAIQRVYPFNGAVRNVVGRGGTSFCPPLERVFLAKTGAEAVIYFTDGCGPAPEVAPQVIVIWALTHGGEPPCDWGKVLRVESD